MSATNRAKESDKVTPKSSMAEEARCASVDLAARLPGYSNFKHIKHMKFTSYRSYLLNFAMDFQEI
jgi:hypothetical protein